MTPDRAAARLAFAEGQIGGLKIMVGRMIHWTTSGDERALSGWPRYALAAIDETLEGLPDTTLDEKARRLGLIDVRDGLEALVEVARPS